MTVRSHFSRTDGDDPGSTRRAARCSAPVGFRPGSRSECRGCFSSRADDRFLPGAISVGYGVNGHLPGRVLRLRVWMVDTSSVSRSAESNVSCVEVAEVMFRSHGEINNATQGDS